MKKPQYAHHCVIYPMYEDLGYEKFVCWEVYYCECEKFNWDNCECYYQSEPMETSVSYRDALKLAKEVSKRYAPIILWGVRF